MWWPLGLNIAALVMNCFAENISSSSMGNQSESLSYVGRLGTSARHILIAVFVSHHSHRHPGSGT